MATRRTLVGQVNEQVLAFTAGKDRALDKALVEVDCIGTAAHVTMLAGCKSLNIISAADRTRIVAELVSLIRLHRAGRFQIRAADQDVHLAVERLLTDALGDIGKRVHTARSRNDQVALDLRLHGREALLGILEAAAGLAEALVVFGRRHRNVPMVGRTHLQPAMPSSVGLWATAHAEALLDDLGLVEAAYTFNDKSPLGSAAGYGVPLAIDPERTAKLLGFRSAFLNVLNASNSRGKCEGVILAALSQVMITLSRLSEDLILFSIPEMGYFKLPYAFTTGSSIMPQKRNPDVLELIRARSAVLAGHAGAVRAIVDRLPSGYHRDLQETKEPFLEGLAICRSCLDILAGLIPAVEVDAACLLAAFRPEVFATDKALDLVAGGMPFRDAYDQVKQNLASLGAEDAVAAIARKVHAGASAGLDFAAFQTLINDRRRAVRTRVQASQKTIGRLLGVPYPALA